MTSLLRWTLMLAATASMQVTARAAEGPIINEIMPGTSRQDAELNPVRKVAALQVPAFLDEDGEASDWLEILNPTGQTVDLDGYGLTDDGDDPYRWIFPATPLAPGGHLIVFTSGKDRGGATAAHFETVITTGDPMRYAAVTEEPPTDWNAPAFDDAAWLAGATPVGFGVADIASTVPTSTEALYLRASFTVPDTTDVVNAYIAVDYDDSFVAYINGHEVARANIGTPGTPAPHYTVPKSRVDSLLVDGHIPDVFAIDDIRSYLVEGENILAVQVNNYPYTTGMNATPFLALGLASVPAAPRGTPDWMTPHLESGNLHTNFKIRADGETLMLTAPDGTRADSLRTGIVPRDHAFGRSPDGGEAWRYFTIPTPGAQNTATGFEGPAGATYMLPTGGFHDAPIAVTLTAEAPAIDIRYTLDGAQPTELSPLYTGPVVIDSTMVLRARAFADGLLPGPVATGTYFIDDTSTIAVVSLATDPANLWDEETGIYVYGAHYTGDTTRLDNSTTTKYTANFWKDWERPVHVEMYEPDGTLGFSTDAGVKIAGKLSRFYFQKSLNLFFRDIYGADAIDYRVFPDLDVTHFTSLNLRISGEDVFGTMFRDAMEVSLARDMKVDTAGYRPALLYINGVFWGIQNLRERMFEDYLAEHHGADPDNVDILEDFGPWGNGIVNEGDSLTYADMRDFILTHSLADSANYAHVAAMMDVENFADLMAAQFYYANGDGPGHNMRYWRERSSTGKFRWMLFDTDFGFAGPIKDQFSKSIGSPTKVDFNWFTKNSTPSGPWWNPKDELFPLNQLFLNTTFKYMFINRFADHLNTCFSSDFVVDRISTMKSVIEPEMPRHLERWPDAIGTMTDWHANVKVMSDFGAVRDLYVRSQIRAKFGLTGTADLTLDVSDDRGGRVRLTTFAPEAYPWTGIYFKGVPMQVTAQPNPGWRFVRWEGADLPASPTASITLDGAAALTAVFEEAGMATSLIINEINYNSADAHPAGDWVEFYNPGNEPVDVSGWVIHDDHDVHTFTMPEGTVVAKWDYLVACVDLAAFSALHGTVTNVVGDLGFGLGSDTDMIRLYTAQGAPVDSVTYTGAAPWPTDANGTGATLSLKNPSLDNTDAHSWAASAAYGTPGEKNDVYITSVADDARPQTFTVYQNFPNPFNPETTIVFDLPRSDHVTVEVYSVVGQRVATLVDTRLDAGRHRVVFTGDNGAAGVYFYRVTAGTSSVVHRMLFMK